MEFMERILMQMEKAYSPFVDTNDLFWRSVHFIGKWGTN